MEYYTILGIEKTATPSEIKKAFYKCSSLYHPDKNGGDEALTEKFKQCNEAYEILSDPEKRTLYDRYGKEGLTQQPFDFFNFNHNLKTKTDDVQINLQVSLYDLYHGRNIKYQYKRNIVCKKCNGNGANGNINTVCPDCKGSKQKITMVRQGNTVYQTLQPCSLCQGQGFKINEKDKCKSCHGQRQTIEDKVINIEIEPGMSYEVIKVYASANEAPNLRTGDLLIQLTPRDEAYERRGDDLIYKMTITLLQALGGKEIILNHISGKSLTLNNSLISPGDIKKLKNHGMPILNYPGEFGDLYIIFNISLDLNTSQISDLINILNPSLIAKLEGLSLEDVKEIPKQHEKKNQQHENQQQCTQQ